MERAKQGAKEGAMNGMHCDQAKKQGSGSAKKALGLWPGKD